jgi:hypothetical protein
LTDRDREGAVAPFGPNVQLILPRLLTAVPVSIGLRDTWKPEDVEESLRKHIDDDLLRRMITGEL